MKTFKEIQNDRTSEKYQIGNFSAHTPRSLCPTVEISSQWKTKWPLWNLQEMVYSNRPDNEMPNQAVCKR